MKKTCIFLVIFGVLCMGVYKQTDADNLRNGLGQTTEIGTIYYSGRTYPIGYRCNVCEHNKDDRVFIPYSRGAQYDALHHVVHVHGGTVAAVDAGSNANIYFTYVKNISAQNNQSRVQIGAIIYSHKSSTHEDGYWCEICKGRYIASVLKQEFTQGSLENALKHILYTHGGKTTAIFNNYLNRWTKSAEIYFTHVPEVQD